MNTKQQVEKMIKNLTTKECKECSGDGHVVVPDENDPTGQTPMQMQCYHCHAEGKYITLDVLRTRLTTLIADTERRGVERILQSVRKINVMSPEQVNDGFILGFANFRQRKTKEEIKLQEIKKEIFSRVDAVMRHSNEVLEVQALEKAKRCVDSVFWEMNV